MAAPFYVYAFWDGGGVISYIGKGSGNRFQAQKRRMARRGVTQGEIIWCSNSERRAYRMERALIARHQPPMNKRPGGKGGLSCVSQLQARLREVRDLRARMKPFWRWVVEDPDRVRFVHHYRSSRRALWQMERAIKRELGSAGAD